MALASRASPVNAGSPGLKSEIDEEGFAHSEVALHGEPCRPLHPIRVRRYDIDAEVVKGAGGREELGGRQPQWRRTLVT